MAEANSGGRSVDDLGTKIEVRTGLSEGKSAWRTKVEVLAVVLVRKVFDARNQRDVVVELLVLNPA